jgi:tellurite resistance protein TehA-like permease
MTHKKSQFRDELAIIPWFMYVLVGIGFVCIAYLFVVYMPLHDPHAPPQPWRTVLAILMGAVAAAYLLLVGYVSQDTKRRNMNQFGWTLLVIIFANGLAPLVYFLLRKPLVQHCPKCGAPVEAGFHFCAKCGLELSPSCPSCGQKVEHDFLVCPYCGKNLAGPTAAVTNP